MASEGHLYQGLIENGHWVDAAQLQPGDRLLNDDGSWTEVVGVEIEAEPLEAFNRTVADFHTYFVATNDNAAPVWVHNDCFEDDLIANGGKRLDDGTIIGGYGNRFTRNADGTYTKVGPASSHEIVSAGVGSNWASPDSPGFKNWRATQRYENAGYHGPVGNPVKGPRPTNPEVALDNSYSIGSNSIRRVGVDKGTGEFVIFDNTGPGLWHGHARTWGQLNNQQRATLRRAGVVNRNDRIR